MVKIEIIYEDINELNVYRMKILKLLKEYSKVSKYQYNFVTNKVDIYFTKKEDFYHVFTLNTDVYYKKYDKINDIIFEEIKDIIKRAYTDKEFYIVYNYQSWTSWNGNYKTEFLNEFEVEIRNKKNQYEKIFANKKEMVCYVNDSIDREIKRKEEDIKELLKRKIKEA